MKPRYIIAAIGGVIIIAAAGSAGAVNRVPVLNAKSGTIITIPEQALEKAPNIFSLGLATDVDGKIVEGFAIIHPKREYHHKPNHNKGNGGNGGDESSNCYALLAKDARWKTTEPYIVNPTNNDGVSWNAFTNALTAGMNEWESPISFDIFGNGTTVSSTLVADEVAPDGNNEVYFGTLDNSNTIAVTIVWGIFGGPPFQRELREWDMVFNDPDYVWGDATINPTVMDVENITVHELGHAAGLSHPADTCTEETMYRFGAVGETKKRDLNAGDITGIQKLY
jgi:hypothetical protein